MYSRLSSQTWMISPRWIIELLFLGWDLNSPKLRGDLNQALSNLGDNCSVLLVWHQTNLEPKSIRVKPLSSLLEVIRPGIHTSPLAEISFVTFDLISPPNEIGLLFWPHLALRRDRLVTLTSSRLRTRWVCYFDLLSPPDEIGLIFWPYLPPRREGFVTLTYSRPRTRYKVSIPINWLINLRTFM